MAAEFLTGAPRMAVAAMVVDTEVGDCLPAWSRARRRARVEAAVAVAIARIIAGEDSEPTLHRFSLRLVV
jgi:hypothetical protein